MTISFLAGMFPPSSYTFHKDHSAYCGKIVGQDRLMSELDIIGQDAVLSCPHTSHEAVRMLFRTTCNTESTNPEEGKLF